MPLAADPVADRRGRSHPRWRSAVVTTALAAAAACGTADDPVYVDAVVGDSPSTVVEEPPPPVTELRLPIVIDRAWSPENAIAELVGSGARADDPVVVDERPADVVGFEIDDAGAFVLRVRIVDEGAHTVCLRDECSRVFTLAPDAESIEDVEAKIDEALLQAASIFDGAALFPEWTVAVSGPFSGTGGTTDLETKTITIYANRERTIDEFVTTILHEWGHVVDAERLTEEERADYVALRGLDPGTPWRTATGHGIDEWAMQPSEDFAEVMVALWTDGAHVVRTAAPVGQPTSETFDAVTSLVAS